MSRSSEGQGHNAACLWKGHDLSNNVCEFEINQLTNEKLFRGKRNFYANCFRPIYKPKISHKKSAKKQAFTFILTIKQFWGWKLHSIWYLCGWTFT